MTQARVRTVLGDVPAEQLGIVYAHEHLIIQGGLGVMKKSDLKLDSIDKAIQEVSECQRLGAATFIDYMPLDSGRNPAALVEISQRTGAHVVAATGFHKPMYYDDLHWIYHYSVEQIAELLVQECEQGMDRYSGNGPLPERIAARAGLIKGASDYNSIAAVSRKLFEAAAIAHLRTGIPIATHTEHGTCGLEQVELLGRLGVKAEHIIVCHMDRNPDLYVHRELAATGCYLEYDNATRVKYHPDAAAVKLLMDMVAAGFEDRIMLGTDFALRSYWRAYGGGPGMAHLLARFVPRLRREGVPEAVLAKLIASNAHRAYRIREHHS